MCALGGGKAHDGGIYAVSMGSRFRTLWLWVDCICVADRRLKCGIQSQGGGVEFQGHRAQGDVA